MGGLTSTYSEDDLRQRRRPPPPFVRKHGVFKLHGTHILAFDTRS